MNRRKNRKKDLKREENAEEEKKSGKRGGDDGTLELFVWIHKVAWLLRKQFPVPPPLCHSMAIPL